ncbi:hypothetical protein DEU56DRAFT_837551 [Suillus clintonianus]|uniref:uncharacterized protein n=1 Tax=Suillus clintonianus TaxID=1904413 RepID=UPI001B87B876|nr:uncharacterized protein DEU56DRAFT_837551 [Suillus clintonianus]KAG2118636.1 hypothetical protein DEU56DRAFT_837551 [Suillus clintonianus]
MVLEAASFTMSSGPKSLMLATYTHPAVMHRQSIQLLGHDHLVLSSPNGVRTCSEDFHLPKEASQQVAEDSGRNLRKALLVFEGLKMQSPDLSGSLKIAKPDWEMYCHEVADLIVQELSSARIFEVCGKFYELLGHCIPQRSYQSTL